MRYTIFELTNKQNLKFVIEATKKELRIDLFLDEANLISTTELPRILKEHTPEAYAFVGYIGAMSLLINKETYDKLMNEIEIAKKELEEELH